MFSQLTLRLTAPMRSKSIFSAFALLMSISAISPALTACTKQMDHGSGMGTTASPMDHGSTGTAESPAAMGHDMGSMDLGPKDETFDLRFIDGMILHHQGAVVMAQDALEHSNRDEIRQLAQAIVAAQQTEIEQMQQWRQAWYPDAGPNPMMYHAQMGHMMEMSEEMKAAMMMNVDLGEAGDQYDLRFLDAMIPHHEGALVMAEQALERSDRPEIQELSRNILSTQQQEIDKMKQWKKDWYGQ